VHLVSRSSGRQALRARVAATVRPEALEARGLEEAMALQAPLEVREHEAATAVPAPLVRVAATAKSGLPEALAPHQL
jgi:hypothetical protein